jgi:hypothetical protein
MTVLYEEHERQRREAVAECERLLLEVQQSLLVRNSVDVVERRLADAIDEGARTKAEGERLAHLQGGLTQPISEMKAVLADEEVQREPSRVEHDESERPSTWTAETIDDAAATLAEAEPARLADAQTGPTLPADVQVQVTPTVAETPTETSAPALPNGLFDAEDDSFVRHIVEVTCEPVLFDAEDDRFVRHLLEGAREPALPPDSTDLAHAESGRQTVTTGDGSLSDMFDAEDDTFARHLPPEDS